MHFQFYNNFNFHSSKIRRNNGISRGWKSGHHNGISNSMVCNLSIRYYYLGERNYHLPWMKLRQCDLAEHVHGLELALPCMDDIGYICCDMLVELNLACFSPQIVNPTHIVNKLSKLAVYPVSLTKSMSHPHFVETWCMFEFIIKLVETILQSFNNIGVLSWLCQNRGNILWFWQIHHPFKHARFLLKPAMHKIHIKQGKEWMREKNHGIIYTKRKAYPWRNCRMWLIVARNWTQ